MSNAAARIQLPGNSADRFVVGRYWRGGRKTIEVEWDGYSEVAVTLDDGSEVRLDKLLCALGRVANLEGMDLPAAGVAASDRGLLPVNADLRATVPGIYAVGDVMGTTSLASSVMDQG